MRALRLIPFLALLLIAACGDDSVECPGELGVPIDILVEPNGLEVDSVVANAEDGLAGRCLPSGHGDAGGSTRFHCEHLGGVKYRVEVRSGPHLWSKSVTLSADDCRDDRVDLRFKLDPATADEFEIVPCTDILLLPIQVKIEPHGLPIDSVTAHNRETLDCQPGFRGKAQVPAMFSCQEQGAGTYRVQVTSGDYAWTQSVELHANECHVINRAELDFDLDPETADGS